MQYLQLVIVSEPQIWRTSRKDRRKATPNIFSVGASITSPWEGPGQGSYGPLVPLRHPPTLTISQNSTGSSIVARPPTFDENFVCYTWEIVFYAREAKGARSTSHGPNYTLKIMAPDANGKVHQIRVYSYNYSATEKQVQYQQRGLLGDGLVQQTRALSLARIDFLSTGVLYTLKLYAENNKKVQFYDLFDRVKGVKTNATQRFYLNVSLWSIVNINTSADEINSGNHEPNRILEEMQELCRSSEIYSHWSCKGAVLGLMLSFANKLGNAVERNRIASALYSILVCHEPYLNATDLGNSYYYLALATSVNPAMSQTDWSVHCFTQAMVYYSDEDARYHAAARMALALTGCQDNEYTGATTPSARRLPPSVYGAEQGAKIRRTEEMLRVAGRTMLPKTQLLCLQATSDLYVRKGDLNQAYKCAEMAAQYAEMNGFKSSVIYGTERMENIVKLAHIMATAIRPEDRVLFMPQANMYAPLYIQPQLQPQNSNKMGPIYMAPVIPIASPVVEHGNVPPSPARFDFTADFTVVDFIDADDVAAMKSLDLSSPPIAINLSSPPMRPSL